jgi:hypothetical protein
MRFARAPALLLATSLFAGCAVSGGGEPGYEANRYGVDFYEPFDNSRSYGPAYLVGPPNRARLFPNDEGARSSGRSLQMSPNPAPSIPSTPPNPSLPTSPVQAPVH